MGGMKDQYGDQEPPWAKRRPETPVSPGGTSGLAIGHAAAERAALRAGEAWKERAYTAFLAYMAAHSTFTTEEVRLASPEVGEPPDRRAWGQVAKRAERAGYIAPNRWIRSTAPNTHGRLVMEWKRK